MKDNSFIIANAKETIIAESKAIAKLADFIDSDFENAVTHIHNFKGRVIFTGSSKYKG